MPKDSHYLYWKDQLVGTVTDVRLEGWPWIGGQISLAPLSKEVREVLTYVDAESKTEDGLQDWPFSDEMGENWKVVNPDGTEVEIMCPVVDFAEGYVTWR